MTDVILTCCDCGYSDTITFSEYLGLNNSPSCPECKSKLINVEHLILMEGK